MTHHPDEEFEKSLVKFESAVGQHEYIFSRDPVGSDAQDAGRRKAEAKKKLIDSHQTAISLAREEERKQCVREVEAHSGYFQVEGMERTAKRIYEIAQMLRTPIELPPPHPKRLSK